MTGDRAALHRADVWIFDLDNTLYPASCNLFEQVDRHMGAFISDLLGIDRTEARGIQKRYFREHGTTLRGLMVNHDVDPHRFLNYVHDIDYSPVPVDPVLDEALAALPARKVIFTNGTKHHAERVLERLGITDHFEAVYDIVDADFIPKPSPGPYRDMIDRHGIDPASAVMVEDIAKNLIEPAALGMQTVWVRTDHAWSGDGVHDGAVHHVTDDLGEWLAALVRERAANA